MKNKHVSDVDNLNPIYANGSNVERTIKTISIVFALLIPILLYHEFNMTTFLFSDIVKFWDISATLYFLPILILAIGIFPFFIRKKAGWFLLAIYLTHCTVFSIGLFIQAINWEPSNIPLIDKLFVQKFTPIACVILFVFFGGALWTICKEKIRIIYGINRRNMLLPLGFIATLTTVISIYFDRYVI